MNVHFYTLLLDGVFAEGEDGSLEFHAAEPPSDEEVARLLATIYRRVQRLLARRGLDVDDPPDVDPLAEESPALAGISSASIQGRIALGLSRKFWAWVRRGRPRGTVIVGVREHPGRGRARRRVRPGCRGRDRAAREGGGPAEARAGRSEGRDGPGFCAARRPPRSWR